jgi:hypothetical protein
VINFAQLSPYDGFIFFSPTNLRARSLSPLLQPDVVTFGPAQLLQRLP